MTEDLKIISYEHVDLTPEEIEKKGAFPGAKKIRVVFNRLPLRHEELMAKEMIKNHLRNKGHRIQDVAPEIKDTE